MEYVLLIISPLLISLKTLMQGNFTKKNNINVKQSFLFNALFSLVGAIILAILYLRNLPSLETIIFGLVLGLLTSLFQTIYLLAFKKGPISISGIIISLSILLPTLYGFIFLSEAVTISKISGIVLIIISLILLNISKENEKKINKIYLVLISAAFILSGSINILQSTFNTLKVSNERNVLLFIMYLSSFVFSLIFAFIIKPKEKLVYKINTVNVLSPIITGAILAIQNVLLMFLLTYFGATIYFPVSSALNIVFLTISTIILFKEKIKTTQIIGIVLAIISVIIINVTF